MTSLDPQMVSLILGNVADGVFTVDRDFKITFFNPAAEEITGFSRDEAIGRPCFEIFVLRFRAHTKRRKKKK